MKVFWDNNQHELDSAPACIGVPVGSEICTPFFGRVFQHNHFEQIFLMLHVSKGDPQEGVILDILIPNYQNAFSPERCLSADKTTVAFSGRFATKQYMTSKPYKYRIKAFTSAHGCMLNCLVCTSADTLQGSSSSYSSVPQPVHTVLHRLEPYLGKGHTVITDRNFNIRNENIINLDQASQTNLEKTQMANLTFRVLPAFHDFSL